VKPYRTAIRLVTRVAAFCLPIGPVFFVLGLTIKAIDAGSLRDAIVAFRPAAVLLGCPKVSALALPTVAMLSIGMHLLGKLRRDSFPIAFGIGTVLICLGIGITTFVIVGPSRGIDPYIRFGPATIVKVVLTASALLSALYWLIAVRRDRKRRRLVEQHEQALEAME
jgi:hypothetical protein